ncbi:hypothetical protein N2152v2_004066 [Parachlorella kessleri]
MQLFVRNLAGKTAVLNCAPSHTVKELKEAVQARDGIPTDSQVLTCNSKLVKDAQLVCSLGNQATLHLTSRLLGGKPVKVKIATNHLPCGQEVTIDIGPDASCSEIKQKLVHVTGVPVEHQTVLLSGANQIILADKRQVVA